METQQLKEWIVNEGKRLNSPNDFLHAFIQLLNEQGMQIVRATINIKTLHPEIGAITYQWYNDNRVFEVHYDFLIKQFHHSYAQATVVENVVSRSVFQTKTYLEGPFHVVRDLKQTAREKIHPESTGFKYPILQDLQQIGATEYLAHALEFTNGDFNVASWATKKKGGFSEADLQCFYQLAPTLATCAEIFANQRIIETLLEIYLGEKTGRQVLKGQIQRGDITSLQSVIWVSDLRGFTVLSERFDSRHLVNWLNDYFEAISGPIRSHGGEILKFIGDAVLAIFPLEDAQTPQVLSNALRAAKAANHAIETLNQQREQAKIPLLKHGIALHVGEVQYGNIGAHNRLDFTIIGSAVNLASRIESLCGKLEKEILLSEAFATNLPEETWEMGQYSLKGIAIPQKIFTPK